MAYEFVKLTLFTTYEFVKLTFFTTYEFVKLTLFLKLTVLNFILSFNGQFAYIYLFLGKFMSIRLLTISLYTLLGS